MNRILALAAISAWPLVGAAFVWPIRPSTDGEADPLGRVGRIAKPQGR